MDFSLCQGQFVKTYKIQQFFLLYVTQRLFGSVNGRIAHNMNTSIKGLEYFFVVESRYRNIKMNAVLRGCRLPILNLYYFIRYLHCIRPLLVKIHSQTDPFCNTQFTRRKEANLLPHNRTHNKRKVITTSLRSNKYPCINDTGIQVAS